MSFPKLTRFGFVTSTSIVLTVALASCVDGSLGDATNGGGSAGTGSGSSVGGSVGAGASTGTGAGAGTTGAGAGAGTSATGAGGTSATGAGGTTVTGAGGTTVTGAGGASASGGSGGTEPVCTNVQHPDHPDKECSYWLDTPECGAAWLTGAGYCLESCGLCSNGSGGTSGTGGTGSVSDGSNSRGLENLTGGDLYFATRYWDCCKTHCATNAGAKSCGQDGVSQNNGSSSCGGGSAYACYSEAPRAVEENVSYGYVAVPNPQCNACYHIQFTGTGQYNAKDPGSVAIQNKHMIVKVSNTGHDVNSKQFDLMIPGGGVGANTQGCQNQWGNIDFGATYGGFLSYENPRVCYDGSHEQRKECVRGMCDQLPAGDARDGCYWWVDWLELADNPNFRYEQINCPGDI